MSDRDLRELERMASLGDPGAAQTLGRAQRRARFDPTKSLAKRIGEIVLARCNDPDVSTPIDRIPYEIDRAARSLFPEDAFLARVPSYDLKVIRLQCPGCHERRSSLSREVILDRHCVRFAFPPEGDRNRWLDSVLYAGVCSGCGSAFLTDSWPTWGGE